MAAIKPAQSFRTSKAFAAEFEKAKKGGLNANEVGKLQDIAASEISKSSKPQALAALYSAEFKGWVAKGLAKPQQTSAESADFVFKSLADIKSINEGAKMLSTNSTALKAKYPDLKDVNLKSARLSDFGDSSFMSIKDTKGKEILENDPRMKTIRTILGSAFKTVNIGAWDM